jgi:hypothetical protein
MEEEFNFIHTELPQKEYSHVLSGIYGDYAKALLVFARQYYGIEGKDYVSKVSGEKENETRILEEFNYYIQP